jgi:hypothetical protein
MNILKLRNVFKHVKNKFVKNRLERDNIHVNIKSTRNFKLKRFFYDLILENNRSRRLHRLITCS